MPDRGRAEKETDRYQTLEIIGKDVAGLLNSRRFNKQDYRNKASFNEEHGRLLNENYWRIVGEFRTSQFRGGRINNPKIASILVYCACTVAEKVILIPDHKDYEEYGNIVYCRQIVRSVLGMPNPDLPREDWENLDLCTRELRRYKPKDWQPIIPLLNYRFDNIWVSSRGSVKEQLD
jgi:hypothetical protein